MLCLWAGLRGWACSSWLGGWCCGRRAFRGLVGASGHMRALSWFASMWAHVGACLWAEVALAWRARERMWALVGGCDECLWALVSAGAFLMKRCASGCERI